MFCKHAGIRSRSGNQLAQVFFAVLNPWESGLWVQTFMCPAATCAQSSTATVRSTVQVPQHGVNLSLHRVPPSVVLCGSKR